ncbi:MAG: serine hydrolase domain-containing protein [Bacteroidota bacterium]
MKVRALALLLAAIVLAGINTTNAQNAQQRNETAMQALTAQINSRNADAVYDMLGADFQARFSRQKFTGVLRDNIFPLGGVKSSALVKMNGGVSLYKVIHERETLSYFIGVNDSDKIYTLSFKPYKEKAARKTYTDASSNALKTTLDVNVDSIARGYIGQVNTVGLAIGLIKGAIVHYYGYGETTKGNKTIPSATTVFEIGSITKTFTATLLAHYVTKGKVSLADPITKYLPDSVTSNKALAGITLQMLSNHTSGLVSVPYNMHLSPSYNNEDPYAAYTKKDMHAFLTNCSLQSAPGEKYAYSNLAVGLLGVILEQVSGLSYEAMVKKVITTPLKMTMTSEHLSKGQQKVLVSVYKENGTQTVPWTLQSIAAAGCLRSTVDDLLLYAKANLAPGNTPLGEAMKLTHKITFEPQQVALGWHTHDSASYLWHNGGTGGSRSFLAFNKANGTAVVVLANSAISADEVGLKIMELLGK